MSEERNKAEDVERLKEELNEWIDHRIADYNAFISSPKKETLSLLFALLPLLAICGSWILGILKQYYIYSLHLVFILWTVVGITESIAKRKGTKELAHINLKDAVYFSFSNMRAMVFSLGVLFFLCIVVLSLVKDLRWWLWILPLLWVIVTLIYEKAVTNAATMVEGDYKIELNTFRKKALAWIAIALIIGLIAALVYVFYKTSLEIYFMISEDPSGLFGIILTLFAILISYASLSEYLSIKFTIADVTVRKNELSMLKMEIDKMNVEELERVKKNLRKWPLPMIEKFLFFNYYRFMPTRYTFEVDEKDEKSNRN